MTGSMEADISYDQTNSAKLRIVKPSTAVDKFNYKNATGAIEVRLAHFGRFQTGTSIQGPLFYPPFNTDGCEDIDLVPKETTERLYNMDWKGFVIVKDGNCTFEEKARNM